jgi:AcrR family transcriptional regulator
MSDAPLTRADPSDIPPVIGRGPDAEMERRLRILDAATGLFDARGFEGTTTDDIAATAGVTKRTLYRYVGSKEQLLFEIHDRFLHDLLLEVTGQSGTPEERIRAMFTAQMRVLARHRKAVKVFFEENKHLSPPKRAELVQVRKAYESVLHSILADGRSTGVFAEHDLRLMVLGILGAINDTYRWYRADGQYSPDELARWVADFFLNGLVPRDGTGGTSTFGPALLAGLPRPRHNSDQQPLGRIVEAATELFRRKGYHGANTRELAEAAGITKGALFYHVGHKEEVLVRIHDMVMDHAVLALTNAEAAGGHAAEVVARMMVSHTRVIAQDRNATAVVSEEMKYLPEEQLKRVMSRRQQYLNLLERAIIRGCERGELVTEDPRLAALMIVGMLNSTYRWYRPEGPLTPDDMGLGLAGLILYGLLDRENGNEGARIPTRG